jgi:predicted nucleic acid-binding protein
VRIFLDANIIFLAGYSPASPVHDLLALARHGLCELVMSAYAQEEARRNLEVKGPPGWAEALERASLAITLVGEAQAPALELARQARLADPADVPILAAAIQCRAHMLVSGDRRAFGTLFGSRVAELEVLTLRDALRRLL